MSEPRGPHELESRLSEGLSRHAAGLPIYEGDLNRVTRRGRRRRVAARGAGAFGALVLLGGGLALVATREGEPKDLTATADGDAVPLIEEATPTPPEPTPAPTPEPEPEPEDPTPEPAATPDPEEGVRNIFAVTATGWGAGLVGSSGEYFATLVCCEDSGLDWRSQTIAEPAFGSLRVRDDLAGGLIASSTDSLWWVPAEGLDGDETPILLTTRADGAGEGRIDLWDVAVIDGITTVLYSTVEEVIGEDDDGEPFLEGRAHLVQATIAEEAELIEGELASTSWTAENRDAAHVWTGASFLAEGGHMEVRSRLDGSCEWMVFEDDRDLYESPSDPPTSDGDCPQASIGGATVNGDGQVAVIERYLSEPPLTAQVVVYDRQANRQGSWDLPPTEDGQGRWTEIDMVGSAVLVSRASTVNLDLDEVLSINVNADPPADPFPLRFVGNPSLARSNITTDALSSISSESPLWFGGGDVVAAPDPEPEPDATPEPEVSPTPVTEPTPEPEPAPPTPVPGEIDPAWRIATGHGVDIKTSGKLVGDDGCLGAICIGDATADALDLATAAFGDEDSDSPEALREGEPPPDNEHIFITDQVTVEIVEGNGLVSSIRVWPRQADQLAIDPFLTAAGAPGPGLTLGDVLRKHGAPAEIFNAGGEGIQVLWLFYDTDTAEVAYGFTEFWGGERFLLEEGDLTIPEAYDDLAVNSYWARPAGL